MNVEHLISKGSAALNQGKLAQALQCFARVEVARPGDPSVLSFRGVALSGLGRYQAALECFEQATAVPPERVDVRRNIGFMLLMLNRREEALIQVDRALALDPDDTILPQHPRAGAARLGTARGSAGPAIRLALAVDPVYIDAMVNWPPLWNLLLGRNEERLACLDRAVAVNPRHMAALQQRSEALYKFLRIDEALAMIEQASVFFDPQSSSLRFSCGIDQLLRGDLVSASAAWRLAGILPRLNGSRFRAKRRLWLGHDHAGGQNLLVHGEQGLGDILHLVRYAPMAARAARR